MGLTAVTLSLDFDSNDLPHISYIATSGNTGGIVRYATWDGTAWQIEAVAELDQIVVGIVGARHVTWLRVDTLDQPHIVYSDQLEVGYAKRGADGVWTETAVATAGPSFFGQNVVLDLDSQDHPHIVYAIGTPPEGIIRYVILR